MAKRLTILGGIIIILIVFSQLLLPSALSEIVAGAVMPLLNTEKVEARVEKFPAVWMIDGQFDRITVKARDAQADKVMFDELELDLDHVRIDIGNLVRQRKLTMQSAENITLRGVIAERELASMINKTVKGAKNAAVRITPGKIEVKSDFSLGGVLRATVALEGKIIALDDQIVFKTEQFAIDNSMLGKFGGAVFTDLVLLDLKKLPFDVSVKDVVLEDGRTVIYANNHP